MSPAMAAGVTDKLWNVSDSSGSIRRRKGSCFAALPGGKSVSQGRLPGCRWNGSGRGTGGAFGRRDCALDAASDKAAPFLVRSAGSVRPFSLVLISSRHMSHRYNSAAPRPSAASQLNYMMIDLFHFRSGEVRPAG